MKHYDAQALYHLLPAVYRQRDAEQGYPLRDLVTVLAEQAEVLGRDIDRLYDSAFIETSDEWVVPYLGDLLGVRGLRPDRRTSARAEVANTIRYRRRKGTAGVLEQLARDVTDWPARVVEFFTLLATTQFVNHVRLLAPATADIRRADLMELVDTPFDRTAHTVDVRRIEPREGCHNIPHVGLYLFRLIAYPLLVTQPHAVNAASGRYTFSSLGHDKPLFTHPESETGPASIAQEIHVPIPIRRRALHADLAAAQSAGSTQPSRYVGSGLSIGVFRQTATDWQPVPGPFMACNLSDWNRPIPNGVIAIDPVLGRLRFADPNAAPAVFRLSCYSGFPDALGGGQYDRSATPTDLSDLPDAQRFWVGDPNDPRILADPEIDTTSAQFHEKLVDALVAAQNAWPDRQTRLIEVVDSRTYSESVPKVEIPSGASLVIRAADGQRPTLIMAADLEVEGQADSGLELDGLWVAGAGIVLRELAGAGGPVGLDRLVIRHTTLVPGLTLQPGGNPGTSAAVSLTAEANSTEIVIERSILGGVRTAPEVETQISNSVLDVHDPAGETAYGGLSVAQPSGGPLEVDRSTVIGQIDAAAVQRGDNTLFLGRVIAERRQVGCVRYSWVPPESRVPRRYRCQPEIATGATDEEAAKIAARLAPRFVTVRFGQPAYCQLDWRGPQEILRGAEDGSEMGVYASLQQPLREDDLRLRLNEYLPVGLEAGILLAT